MAEYLPSPYISEAEEDALLDIYSLIDYTTTIQKGNEGKQ